MQQRQHPPKGVILPVKYVVHQAADAGHNKWVSGSLGFLKLPGLGIHQPIKRVVIGRPIRQVQFPEQLSGRFLAALDALHHPGRVGLLDLCQPLHTRVPAAVQVHDWREVRCEHLRFL